MIFHCNWRKPGKKLHINGSLFLVGTGIGLLIALIGGIVEYWISLRHGAQEGGQRLPGCLLFVGGGLGVAGIIAVITSLIINQGITDALIVGAGTLTGFYAGFFLLFSIWFLLNRQ